jgi:hypothetical protein
VSSILATGLAAQNRRTIRDMTDDDGIVDAHDVPFANAGTGLVAENVQEALEEIRVQAQIYEFTIMGNATDTEFTVPHNLNTTKLNCQLYKADGKLVYTTIRKATPNTIKVLFGHPQDGKTYVLQVSR